MAPSIDESLGLAHSPDSISSPLSTPSPPAEDAPLSQQRPPVLHHAVTSPNTPAMTASSSPLGSINAARRPNPPQPTLSGRGLALPSDIAAKMEAVRLRTSNLNPGPQRGPMPSPASPSPTLGPGGIPANFRMPLGGRPMPIPTASSPALANKSSLAAKRGMAFPGGLPGAPGAPKGRKPPGMTLSQMNGANGDPAASGDASSRKSTGTESLLDKYADFVDAKTGSLKFKGKAVLTNQGVEFASGKSFSISLDEVDTMDELGKGNYGTVYKVRHSRPRMRRPGLGLAGNKASSQSPVSQEESPTSVGGTSGVIMAMKEIRLELDDAKFAAIIMELDILHRCVSPFIVDFYGAFFQEGAVYICMEFMDGGSIDKLYGDGVPEGVLRKITLSTTMGLKSLKEEHNIIHRDVKPTNILANTRGQVKICDFGVSGNLVASIAKTNIGCQSYMAPERISSGGVAQAGANPGGGTYSVQSDIWSLGLTIIECALGRYPYPPETYDNIFSQLSAIVDGEPPDLPADKFSPAARDFVRGCLMKIPKLRPTYAMLLQHQWLAPLLKPPTISEEAEEEAEAGGDVQVSLELVEATTADKEIGDWVKGALERRRNGTMGKSAKPALHAAPLDAVASPAAASAH